MNLVDPLPLGKGWVKFVVVAMDYLTKWAEIEALATITTNNITCFLWKNILFKFGVPYNIISNNGRQFDSDHITSSSIPPKDTLSRMLKWR